MNCLLVDERKRFFFWPIVCEQSFHRTQSNRVLRESALLEETSSIMRAAGSCSLNAQLMSLKGEVKEEEKADDDDDDDGETSAE